MKIGIIQCDHVLDKFVSDHGTYPTMFSNLFSRIRDDLEFVLYDATKGCFPVNLEECDGYITTGSKYGVNDGLPWIDDLEKFVLKLYQDNKKLVGICFGHQIMAKALGGQVELSSKGWGVGVSFNEVTAKQSWMEPYKPGLDLVVSHQDQVTSLPENAKVLAQSDFCPYYIVQYGINFLSFQGHPEFSKLYSKELMNDRRGRIPDRRIREGLASLNAEVDDELAAMWIYNFFS